MQNNTNRSNMSITLVFLIVLGLFALVTWSVEKPFEKLLMMMSGFVFLFPIFIGMTGSILISVFRVKNKPHTSHKNIRNTNTPNINQNSLRECKNNQKKYPTKICTTEGYEQLRDLLKECVMKKLIGRECILKFKSELRYKLGTHIECYNGFEFQNDMHEIYTLLKSRVLTEEDYQYLSNIFIGLLNSK